MKTRLLFALSVFIAGTLSLAPVIQSKIESIVNVNTFGGQSALVSKGSVQEKCEKCHKMEMEFTKKSVHTPFKNWLCTDCHTPHDRGDKPTKLVVDLDKLCGSCHFKQIFNPSFMSKHKPVDKGNCLDCHQPHSSEYESLLITPANQLCFNCHRQVYNPMMKVKHNPVEKGNCQDCHLVHGSENDSLLMVDKKMLCWSCHFVGDGQHNMPSKHPPVAKGECTSCHNPHANGNEKLVLKTTPDLCYDCHQEQRQEQKAAIKHKPFGQEKCLECHEAHFAKEAPLIRRNCQNCHSGILKLDSPVSKHPTKCAACHQPHAASEQKLLRGKGNAACNACHGSLIKEFAQTPHQQIKDASPQGWCTNCHTPHESKYTNLLLQAKDTLCLKCHSAASSRMEHPVQIKFQKDGKDQMLQCVSCHEPHRNQPNFLRKQGNDLCVMCHGSLVQ